MRKRLTWKEILLIIVSATVILGMGSTAVDNFKGIFDGKEKEEVVENGDDTASIDYNYAV